MEHGLVARRCPPGDRLRVAFRELRLKHDCPILGGGQSSASDSAQGVEVLLVTALALGDLGALRMTCPMLSAVGCFSL
jgi:hypothetical protein